MVGEVRRARWWTVTPAGATLLGAILLALGLVSVASIRESSARSNADQAEIERIVAETNAFADSIRCIKARTWMLTSPEAQDAELQQRLAAAGLSAQWVEPEVLDRLGAAKACIEGELAPAR